LRKLDDISEAKLLLKTWKKDSYVFGRNLLDRAGEFTQRFGDHSLLVMSDLPWAKKPLHTIATSLETHGISYSIVLDAKPNCPRADLYRIALQAAVHDPCSIIAFGGGSTIDACKAASVLATYTSNEVSAVLNVEWEKAGSIDPYFGTGMVTQMKGELGRDVLPVIAIQTASSSAAHLTKYSNITDPTMNQKKLIVDDAIVPKLAMFDYDTTLGAPKSLTIDGGLDGIAHSWEVFMGGANKNNYPLIKQVTATSIKLIVEYLPLAIDDPNNVEARMALGLGTDLGGYAIMLGGTSGAHLGSFSLVDILSHGRACGILNPYYSVFFAPKIEDQLRVIGQIFHEHGFIKKNIHDENGRQLGVSVAQGMITFARSLGAPTTLQEAGASTQHLQKMLHAAKDPQLKMKLLNMPVSMDPDKGDVENYMKGILEAAFTGNLELIKTLE
jgi:alcohol dehydrogenase class IV